MVDNKRVVEVARTWIGTPFHHQGRVKQVGVDCIGLVVGVAKELGFSVIDQTNYGREPYKFELEKQLDQQGIMIPKSEMQEGDILVIRFSKNMQHVGIFTGTGMIHAYSGGPRKCVEHSIDKKWDSRIVRVYRYKELWHN